MFTVPYMCSYVSSWALIFCMLFTLLRALDTFYLALILA